MWGRVRRIAAAAQKRVITVDPPATPFKLLSAGMSQEEQRRKIKWFDDVLFSQSGGAVPVTRGFVQQDLDDFLSWRRASQAPEPPAPSPEDALRILQIKVAVSGLVRTLLRTPETYFGLSADSLPLSVPHKASGRSLFPIFTDEEAALAFFPDAPIIKACGEMAVDALRMVISQQQEQQQPDGGGGGGLDSSFLLIDPTPGASTYSAIMPLRALELAGLQIASCRFAEHLRSGGGLTEEGLGDLWKLTLGVLADPKNPGALRFSGSVPGQGFYNVFISDVHREAALHANPGNKAAPLPMSAMVSNFRTLPEGVVGITLDRMDPQFQMFMPDPDLDLVDFQDLILPAGAGAVPRSTNVLDDDDSSSVPSAASGGSFGLFSRPRPLDLQVSSTYCSASVPYRACHRRSLSSSPSPSPALPSGTFPSCGGATSRPGAAEEAAAEVRPRAE